MVVQEIIIKTDNVVYRKEIHYSPSQKKTYMGKTPSEIEGEFGPGVKSTVLTPRHVVNVSESKIHELLEIIYPTSDKGKNNRTRIMEDGAITAHHQQTDLLIIPILLTDDAPNVSRYLLMNKLYAGSMTDETTRSCVLWHQCTAEKLDEFLGQYWDYCGKRSVTDEQSQKAGQFPPTRVTSTTTRTPRTIIFTTDATTLCPESFPE